MRVLAFLLASAVSVLAQANLRLQTVVTGFELPTDIQSPRDGTGRLFVLEQRGRIRVVKNGVLLSTPFVDIRSKVGCCGERGLLGLAFPPQFSSKRHFYVNYTNLQGNTVISRFRVTDNPDIADPGSEQVVLTFVQPFPNHNGGGLVFGPKDGFLYIGTGDGGGGGDPQNNGQRTDTLLGKMLRIDTESGSATYSSPPTNPFVNRTGARPEIWAIGLRNPWRYAFDRETGDLWIADVGQDRAEEVNFQPADSRGGENYGWHRTEGLQCFPVNSSCDTAGLTMPVLEYTRSQGCSVTGGFVYRGNRWPALKGMYLYADYCSGNIWGVRRSASGQFENQLLVPDTRTPYTTFGEDENGELYLADQNQGRLLLITAGPPSTTESMVVNAASFAAGISPGSLATLFGTGVTTFSGIISAGLLPLPREIAGTSITLNSIEAPVVAVSGSGPQEQINFQVPYELDGGSRVTLVVRVNGQSSAPVEIPIVVAQPEVFVVRDGIPAVTTAAGSLVTPSQPAGRGSLITIYATGLGSVTNRPQTGREAVANPLSRVTAPPQVRIGGAQAQVSFAGLAPGFVGLYQINAQVPADAATGDAELILVTGGAASKAVTVAIR
jgi:uncharacterized protein (TIGR03437 family)